MGGVLLPDRSEETLRQYDERSFASPVPTRERDPEDVSEPRGINVCGYWLVDDNNGDTYVCHLGDGHYGTHLLRAKS